MPHSHIPIMFNFTLHVCINFSHGEHWCASWCWCSPTRHNSYAMAMMLHAWMLYTKQWSMVFLVSCCSYINWHCMVVLLELLYHNMRTRKSSQNVIHPHKMDWKPLFFKMDKSSAHVFSVFTIKLELKWSPLISHQQCQSDTGSTII